MAKYFGTPLPQEGYVENIYFNYNLKKSEVIKALKQVGLEGRRYERTSYVIAVNEKDDLALVFEIYVNWSSTSYYICVIDDNNNKTYIFDDSYDDPWLLKTGVIGFNDNLSFSTNIVYSPMEVGIHNDKLNVIFSSTEFKQEKNILMHPKNEDGKMNTNISLYPKTLASNLMADGGKNYTLPNVIYQEAEWSGDKVPVNKYVENIYVNTQLTDGEVVDILSKLEYSENEGYSNKYFYIVACEYNKNSSKKFLVIYKSEDGYYSIQFMTNTAWSGYTIFNNYYDGGWKGWEPEENWVYNDNTGEAGNPLKFNCEASNEMYDNNQNRSTEEAGAQNHLLAGLFSIGTFFKKKQGLFLTKEDGTADETKPLQIGSGGGSSGGGISEDRVNELIDEKIGNFLGGES